MYPLVKIPEFANKDIYTFSKEESREYFKWFSSIKSARIQILERDVQSMFPNWKADYTKESLDKLYEWFEKRVDYREMTYDEKIEIEKQIGNTPLLVGMVEIPETTFTDETVTICFDIGIYFGEIFVKNETGINWIQKINSTKYIDYAQPLIANKVSKVPINTRRVAENMARIILDKDENRKSFLELFEKWILEFSNELKQSKP
jgi:hypothetical protein